MSEMAPPTRLFKYVAPDRLPQIIGPGLIRYSQPNALNDPFEFMVHRPELFSSGLIDKELSTEKVDDLFRKELDEAKAKYPGIATMLEAAAAVKGPSIKGNLRGLVEQVASQILPQFSSLMTAKVAGEFRILSLTETPDNLLMWAHYADSHRGAVLEFDAEHPSLNSRRSGTDELRHPRKVVYVEHMPARALDETDSQVLFLTKGNPWAYEREWRVLQAARFADKVVGQSPNELCLYQLPLKAVVSITFGASADPTWLKIEIARIRSLPESAHLKFYRCRVRSDDYALERIAYES